MSYFAADEAWKQRVAQELNRASQFRNTHESFYRNKTTQGGTNPISIRTIPFNDSSSHSDVKDRHLGSRSSDRKRKSRLQNLLGDLDYKTAKLNLGYTYGGTTSSRFAFKDQLAEVRGKYAPNSTLNPVLARPVTAESLASRRPLEVKQDLTVKTPKSKAYRKRWISLRNELPADAPRTPPKDLKDEADDQYDQIEKQDTADSPGKPVEAEFTEEAPAEESERPATSLTWKTTSSQGRYIQALEKQLQEERKARKELESKVEALLLKQ